MLIGNTSRSAHKNTVTLWTTQVSSWFGVALQAPTLPPSYNMHENGYSTLSGWEVLGGGGVNVLNLPPLHLTMMLGSRAK